MVAHFWEEKYLPFHQRNKHNFYLLNWSGVSDYCPNGSYTVYKLLAAIYKLLQIKTKINLFNTRIFVVNVILIYKSENNL